jgi:cytochrome c553
MTPGKIDVGANCHANNPLLPAPAAGPQNQRVATTPPGKGAKVMIRNLMMILAACALIGATVPAKAGGDTAAGKTYAAKKCKSCHGAKGEGKKKNPPLAGISVEKHVQAMMDYKTGSRKHKLMQRLAKKMSDKQITDVATFYAGLK